MNTTFPAPPPPWWFGRLDIPNMTVCLCEMSFIAKNLGSILFIFCQYVVCVYIYMCVCVYMYVCVWSVKNIKSSYFCNFLGSLHVGGGERVSQDWLVNNIINYMVIVNIRDWSLFISGGRVNMRGEAKNILALSGDFFQVLGRWQSSERLLAK